MNVDGRVAIVTGGGGGIGGALAIALTKRGARVVVADLDADTAAAVVNRANAEQPGAAVPAGADVCDTTAIRKLIELAGREFGPVDLYFANAGITGAPGLEAGDADWAAAIDINLLAHVRAARLLIPDWVRRGCGYFVSTASAAGLLTQLGAASYTVTKHAAVGFAEWLNISYRDQGVRVSCLCPMGVDTALLHAGAQSGNPVGELATRAVTAAGPVLEPRQVADAVLAAVEAEEFLILPHPQVLEMYRYKAADYDRWLAGMRRYQHSLMSNEQP